MDGNRSEKEILQQLLDTVVKYRQELKWVFLAFSNPNWFSYSTCLPRMAVQLGVALYPLKLLTLHFSSSKPCAFLELEEKKKSFKQESFLLAASEYSFWLLLLWVTRHRHCNG